MIIPYANLTQSEVTGRNAVAIIPLAAVEAHGPHLPLGTDGIIVDGILDRAASENNSKFAFYRLPTIWLGASEEHGDRAGTLSRAPEAVISDVVQAAEGLTRAGIGRVLLFNGHGGNIAAAAIAALRLRTKFDMLAVSAHWLDFDAPTGIAPAPVAEDVHGGWVETSALLHLAAHLVKTEAIAPAPATAPAASLYPAGKIAWGWKTSDIAPNGYAGRPNLATAEIGRVLIGHAARKLNLLLDEIAEAKWPKR